MKHLLFLTSLVFLTSFVSIPESKTLPNGHYKVVLDQKYKDDGLNDFEIVIQDNLFTSIIKTSIETLELQWISETAFIVPGFTQPKNIADLPGYKESSERNAFHIFKQTDNVYYFHLGTKEDTNPVFKGKLTKVY